MSSYNRGKTNPVSVEFAAYTSPVGLCHHGFRNPGNVEGIKSFYRHVPSGIPEKIAHNIIMETPSLRNRSSTGRPTLQALAAIGTNLLLHPELETEKGFAGARLTAQVISALDNMYFSAFQLQSEDCWVRQFFRDQMQLELDSRKKLVEFFSERIDCYCLGDVKEAVKNDKTGMCTMCYKKTEHKKLFDCGRCRLVKYCGKECQKKHWKRHKNICKDQALSASPGDGGAGSKGNTVG